MWRIVVVPSVQQREPCDLISAKITRVDETYRPAVEFYVSFSTFAAGFCLMASVKGSKTSAACGINLLSKFIIPRNRRRDLESVGSGKFLMSSTF